MELYIFIYNETIVSRALPSSSLSLSIWLMFQIFIQKLTIIKTTKSEPTQIPREFRTSFLKILEIFLNSIFCGLKIPLGTKIMYNFLKGFDLILINEIFRGSFLKPWYICTINGTLRYSWCTIFSTIYLNKSSEKRMLILTRLTKYY